MIHFLFFNPFLRKAKNTKDIDMLRESIGILQKQVEKLRRDVDFMKGPDPDLPCSRCGQFQQCWKRVDGELLCIFSR